MNARTAPGEPGARSALMMREARGFGSRSTTMRAFRMYSSWAACTSGVVIRPGIVRTQPMAVEIDISHGPSYGRTVCDQRGITGQPVNTQVGVGIDVDGFYDLLVETLARYPAS